MNRYAVLILCALSGVNVLTGAVYDVGPGRTLASIGDVPWANLVAGDIVEIYWRAQPYAEKWVITAQGTKANPITIRGMPSNDGTLPVIDGRDAVTPISLDFWSETRGVVKIGGSSIPANVLPSYIMVENLDIRSAREPYQFLDDNGNTQSYSRNAACIYLERGEHITIRNCILRDSGNGLFIANGGGGTEDILVEACYIYDNGAEGSIYEHNSYTEATDIVFQFNHYGPLRTACLGNNLKDRSAGTVIRYNWIEGGNRQLDLVESNTLQNLPQYRSTFVYGNVLIEPDGDGNSQILHYGGDSGNTSTYRKGTLYFHNNTVISRRTGNTTLSRLSTNDESCDCRNNLLYTEADGFRLALSNAAGTMDLRNNWLKQGWTDSHSTLTGSVNDLGGNIDNETEPGFLDYNDDLFHPALNSSCRDAATAIASGAVGHEPVEHYVPHRLIEHRPSDGNLDVGAYEGWSYVQWREAVFGAETDPNIVGDKADPDHDSTANIIEYTQGTHPLVPDLFSVLETSPAGGGMFSVNYSLHELRGDVNVALETSTDLEIWSPFAGAHSVLGQEGHWIHYEASIGPLAAGEVGFLHMKVEP